jgi:tetraacyldisaccharide-1-P 4'-kinase
LIQFKDHYTFTAKDIAEIQEKFDTFASGKKAIVTTEKDFMRFKPFLQEKKMQQIPWFYQSMQVKIDREQEFIHELNTYVNTI